MKAIERIRSASKKALAARNDLQVALEELRGELFRLSGERDRIEAEPMTREATAARIAMHLDVLEQRALERLSPGSFRTPVRDAHITPSADDAFAPIGGLAGGSGSGSGLFATSTAFEGVGALCALGLRTLIETALLDKAMAAAPGEGISDSERDAKLRKLLEDIDTVERAEEALIREAEEAGITVYRRHDARPEIFLLEEV